MPISMKFLVGSISKEDLKKAFFLSSISLVTIAVFAIIKSVKEPVFATLVGLEYQPYAKMVSIGGVFMTVLMYNKLVDLVELHQIFYIVAVVYGITFSVVALFLVSPQYGLHKSQAHPHHVLGWVTFFATESYASIGMPLFWSFVNSIFSREQAKSTYGLIVAGSQIGAIFGSVCISLTDSLGGIPGMYFMASGCSFLVALIVRLYVHIFGITKPTTSSIAGNAQSKIEKERGCIHSIKMLLKYSFVFGIFIVTCAFETLITKMDYELVILIKNVHKTTIDHARYNGRIGLYTNFITLVLSLGGTSILFRWFGVRLMLMILPIFSLIAVIISIVEPTLVTIQTILLILKAFSIAINSPAKEMLYSVTIQCIKTKTKFLIDAFGPRLMKGLGSLISVLVFKDILVVIIGLAIIFTAFCVGRRYSELAFYDDKIGERKPVVITPNCFIEIV